MPFVVTSQGTQERAVQVASANMHIGFFTAYLSNAVVSGKSPFFFQARVVLKPLVSLVVPQTDTEPSLRMRAVVILCVKYIHLHQLVSYICCTHYMYCWHTGSSI